MDPEVRLENGGGFSMFYSGICWVMTSGVSATRRFNDIAWKMSSRALDAFPEMVHLNTASR